MDASENFINAVKEKYNIVVKYTVYNKNKGKKGPVINVDKYSFYLHDNIIDACIDQKEKFKKYLIQKENKTTNVFINPTNSLMNYKMYSEIDNKGNSILVVEGHVGIVNEFVSYYHNCLISNSKCIVD